jgi:hypothetical protein
MRARCLNAAHIAFHNYGARGITVCERWADYDLFVLDMGFAPDGHSLDRIDNTQGYFAGNCKWSTVKEQLNNQRRNVRLTFDGRTMTASQWADEVGIAAGTLLKRINKYGCSVERALTNKKLKEWRHGTRHGYEKGCRCNECKLAHNKHHRDRRARKKTNVNAYSVYGRGPIRRPDDGSPASPSPAPASYAATGRATLP